MCLRTGEDMQATISLSLESLFISLVLFPHHFPPVGAHESLPPSLQVPFLNTTLFLSTTCLPSLGPFHGPSQTPPRCCVSSRSPSYYGVGMLSHNLDNAGRCARLCLCEWVSVCLSLFEGQVQGLGAQPACDPRGTKQQREKRRVQPRRNQIKYSVCGTWRRLEQK